MKRFKYGNWMPSLGLTITRIDISGVYLLANVDEHPAFEECPFHIDVNMVKGTVEMYDNLGRDIRAFEEDGPLIGKILLALGIKLQKELTKQGLENGHWSELHGLELADPTFVTVPYDCWWSRS